MDWRWSYEFFFFVLLSLSYECSSQSPLVPPTPTPTQIPPCRPMRNSSTGSTPTPTSQVTYQKEMYENCVNGSLSCIGVGQENCIQEGNCLIFATYCTDDQNATQQQPAVPPPNSPANATNGTNLRTYFELTTALPSTQTADKYVALGLSTDSKMGKDAIFGCITYTGTSGSIIFGYSPGYHIAYNIDVQTAGKFEKEIIIFENNAIYCSFSISAEFTIPSNITFNLTKDSPFVLLATGSAATAGTFSYHFPYRSYSTEKVVSVAAKGLQEVIPPEIPWVRGAITTHVICVVFTYISIIPTSMLVARFLRESHVEQRFQDQKIWLVLHILVQWLGILLLLASHITIFFIAGFYKKLVIRGFEIHYILGSTVTLLHVVQFTLGLVLAEGLMYQSSGVRRVGGVLHLINGHVIYFLSLTQIFLAPLFMATHMHHCSSASFLVLFWLVFHLSVYLVLTLMLWRSDAKAIKSMGMIDGAKKKVGQRKLKTRYVRRSAEDDSSDSVTRAIGTGTNSENTKKKSTQMESEPVESENEETKRSKSKESITAESASIGKKPKKLKKASRRSTTGSKSSKSKKGQSRYSKGRGNKNDEALSERTSRKSGKSKGKKGSAKKKSKLSEHSASTSTGPGGRPLKKKKKGGKKGNNKVKPKTFSGGETVTEILPPPGKKMSADDESLEQENKTKDKAKGSTDSDAGFAISAREHFEKAKAAYSSIGGTGKQEDVRNLFKGQSSSNYDLDNILTGKKNNVKSHPYRSFLSFPMKTYFTREYPNTTAVDLIILLFFVTSILVSVSLCFLLVPKNLVGGCGLACSAHELTCPKGKEHHGLHKAGTKTWMKGFP